MMTIRVDNPWGYGYGYYADSVISLDEPQSKLLDNLGRPMIYKKPQIGYNLSKRK